MSAPETATGRVPSNWTAMLLSIIPGAGHYYLDRYLMGALLFGGFVTAVNGIFLGSTLQSSSTHPETLKTLGVVALVAVWLMSVLHTWKQSFGTDRRSLAQNRGILLRAALVDYLRDDLEDSAKKLEQAIELDVDWQDPDPLFHLGVVMLRLAERRGARKLREGARAARRRSQWAFRTCLARDKAQKWRAEIARESKRMRRLLSMTGRSRPASESQSDAAWAVTDSGSFPELRASGAYPRVTASDLKASVPASPASGSESASSHKIISSKILRSQVLSAVSTEPEGPASKAPSPPKGTPASGVFVDPRPTPRALSTEMRKRLVQEALGSSGEIPAPPSPKDLQKRERSPYRPPPTRSYVRPTTTSLTEAAPPIQDPIMHAPPSRDENDDDGDDGELTPVELGEADLNDDGDDGELTPVELGEADLNDVDDEDELTPVELGEADLNDAPEATGPGEMTEAEPAGSTSEPQAGSASEAEPDAGSPAPQGPSEDSAALSEEAKP